MSGSPETLARISLVEVLYSDSATESIFSSQLSHAILRTTYLFIYLFFASLHEMLSRPFISIFIQNLIEAMDHQPTITLNFLIAFLGKRTVSSFLFVSNPKSTRTVTI